jgi:hypothetical protein
MKLYSTIRVDMNEHDILDPPGMLARLRRAFGGHPDHSPGKARAALEAVALVDAHRRALAEVGATDAISLVVDDLVLFEDRDRRPDDLGDMFLAFHEYAPAIDADFRTLRLTVEHREAGIHYVIELQARPEYPKGEAPIRVIVSGRMVAFTPLAGESAEAYRARVEPLVQDAVALQIAQVSFESFVARIRDAIGRSSPDARASVVTPEPTITGRSQSRGRTRRPDDAQYDPHEAHYPNPMFGMLGMGMLGMAMMPAFADDPAALEGDDAGGSWAEGEDGGLFDFDW